jgi:hypothetical protein
MNNIHNELFDIDSLNESGRKKSLMGILTLRRLKVRRKENFHRYIKAKGGKHLDLSPFDSLSPLGNGLFAKI